MSDRPLDRHRLDRLVHRRRLLEAAALDPNVVADLLHRADALLSDALHGEFETSRQAAEDWRYELTELVDG